MIQTYSRDKKWTSVGSVVAPSQSGSIERDYTYGIRGFYLKYIIWNDT